MTHYDEERLGELLARAAARAPRRGSRPRRSCRAPGRGSTSSSRGPRRTPLPRALIADLEAALAAEGVEPRARSSLDSAAPLDVAALRADDAAVDDLLPSGSTRSSTRSRLGEPDPGQRRRRPRSWPRMAASLVGLAARTPPEWPERGGRRAAQARGAPRAALRLAPPRRGLVYLEALAATRRCRSRRPTHAARDRVTLDRAAASRSRSPRPRADVAELAARRRRALRRRRCRADAVAAAALAEGAARRRAARRDEPRRDRGGRALASRRGASPRRCGD